jgi:aconitate hydratase
MVTLSKGKVVLIGNSVIIDAIEQMNVNKINELLKKNGSPELKNEIDFDVSKKGTISYKILSGHNTGKDDGNLKLKFDSLASHDITYVGIIQTARASGLKEFPVPYVLTNCHNSLCAVGGTINEDDHLFGLSAAHKYGGIYVPANQAVIHQYVREMTSGCGKMILGSDSHTRYGALGAMGIGEGGPEIVKQLLNRTYDIGYPEIIAVYLEGSPQKGVGPQDVALSIIKAVYENGYVKNKVMEFVGPGIDSLSIDYRLGIDVMTTETTCLSSIWVTDDKVRDYFKIHNKESEYQSFKPENITGYDGLVRVDLTKIEPMIALPFHPSNAHKIADVINNAKELFEQIEIEARDIFENPGLNLNLQSKIINGKIQADQGIVAGCSGGTFENIVEMTEIMQGKSIGNNAYSLSIYPSSQPVYKEIVNRGYAGKIMDGGGLIKNAFCGPCFGAGDTPANNSFSIRHTTRNFPNREGSKPNQGQLSFVSLVDARSIAATSLNRGILTSAADIDYDHEKVTYFFNESIYQNRIYDGFRKAQKDMELVLGPNIIDWPEMRELTENLLLKISCVIHDPVTTTDELIPSGETSSFRSNPMKLAEFTLSRKAPGYVKKAKEIQATEIERAISTKDNNFDRKNLNSIKQLLKKNNINESLRNIGIGSVVIAKKPGDGSAREQAASCQKVLGGLANIAIEYATKRYKSNLINWGMLPLIVDGKDFDEFNVDDFIYLRNVKKALESGKTEIEAEILSDMGSKRIILKLTDISSEERKIMLKGCLINYYKV